MSREWPGEPPSSQALWAAGRRRHGEPSDRARWWRRNRAGYWQKPRHLPTPRQDCRLRRAAAHANPRSQAANPTPLHPPQSPRKTPQKRSSSPRSSPRSTLIRRRSSPLEIIPGQAPLGIAMVLEMLLRAGGPARFDAFGDIGIGAQIPLLIDAERIRLPAFEISFLDEVVPRRFEPAVPDGLRDIGVFLEVPIFVNIDAAQQKLHNFFEFVLG